MARARVDRHVPDRGHVHAEARARRDDERELGAHRDDPERDRPRRATAERPGDQDVRGERAEHEHDEPEDVLRGPGGQDAEVLALAPGEDPRRPRGGLELGLFLHVHGAKYRSGSGLHRVDPRDPRRCTELEERDAGRAERGPRLLRAADASRQRPRPKAAAAASNGHRNASRRGTTSA